jgi:uncharacterized protein YyaL (SSP411 family)
MIAALARGARVLDRPELADAAVNAVRFVFEEMRDPDGRLLHRYRDGESAIPGYLDDYAFMIWGLIELYEETFEPEWLARALSLSDDMVRLFSDAGKGGFFFTGSDAEKLISRTREIYDGAVPSGNSVAAWCLFKLGRMTGRQDLESVADDLLKEFSGQISGSPAAYTQMLIALDFALGPGREYVIVGERGDEETQSMISMLTGVFAPGAVTLLRAEKESEILEMVPMLESMKAVDGRPTAYICSDFRCAAPAVGPDELKKRLGEMEKKSG